MTVGVDETIRGICLESLKYISFFFHNSGNKTVA